jgi:hypothetical protein
MGRAVLVVAAVGVAVAALVVGCNLSGNGHVTQTKFFAVPGDDVVNCACNLTFDNEHCSGGHCAAHFSLRLCLPPSLQSPQSPDGGSDQQSAAVDGYCRDTATHVVYHMIKVFNGGWCDYKAPYAPDGGVGSSVECFAQEIDDGRMRATTSDDGTCRQSCAPVVCDYATNCGSDVQDYDGTIHPDRCKCSIITRYGCPGDPASDLPTALFCRPPG